MVKDPVKKLAEKKTWLQTWGILICLVFGPKNFFAEWKMKKLTERERKETLRERERESIHFEQNQLIGLFERQIILHKWVFQEKFKFSKEEKSKFITVSLKYFLVSKFWDISFPFGSKVEVLTRNICGLQIELLCLNSYHFKPSLVDRVSHSESESLRLRISKFEVE